MQTQHTFNMNSYLKKKKKIYDNKIGDPYVTRRDFVKFVLGIVED